MREHASCLCETETLKALESILLLRRKWAGMQVGESLSKHRRMSALSRLKQSYNPNEKVKSAKIHRQPERKADPFASR